MVHIASDKLRLALIPGIALSALTIGTALVAQAHQTPPGTTVKPVTTGALQSATQPLPELIFNGPWKSDSKTDVMVGNSFIYRRGDATTTGDHARFKRIDKKTGDGVLDADGNLVYDDPQHHATCNKAHVDMVAKLSVFMESVVLVLKPEQAANAPAGRAPQQDAAPAGQADDNTGKDVQGQKKHGVTVYCDRMEDQYKKKYIKLYGHLIFKQKYVDSNGKTVERVLTAEHAEYNGKSEVMELYGPVDGHDGDGQEVHSTEKVTIGTKEGEETLEGTKLVLKFLPQEDNGDNGDNGTDNNATKEAGTKESGTTKETNTKGKQ